MDETAKPASESASEMVQLVLPNEINPHGSVLGGIVMHWMDLAAAIVAHRHARRPVVTAAVDHITFAAPIRVGQLAILRAHLSYVGRSSMEVTVRVDAEDLSGGIRSHTSTAYFTFVAIDDQGNPTPVPKLRLDTDAEREENRLAGERRKRRLALREAVGGERAG
jgi:acyl-CoA hydrolase